MSCNSRPFTFFPELSGKTKQRYRKGYRNRKERVNTKWGIVFILIHPRCWGSSHRKSMPESQKVEHSKKMCRQNAKVLVGFIFWTQLSACLCLYPEKQGDWTIFQSLPVSPPLSTVSSDLLYFSAAIILSLFHICTTFPSLPLLPEWY